MYKFSDFLRDKYNEAGTFSSSVAVFSMPLFGGSTSVGNSEYKPRKKHKKKKKKS